MMTRNSHSFETFSNAVMTRRSFVGATTIATFGAMLTLSGCGESRSSTSDSSQSSSGKSEAQNSTNANTNTNANANASASLVLVFSRANENYNVGTVEVGNTMKIAQEIVKQTGADLFEIERTTAYPAGYDACCDEALTEKDSSARPQLKAMPDISGYKNIYVGFPCWWGDMPMPVYTAIEALDWNGKSVRPFNTHEGSGESGMFSTLAKKCSGATVTNGLTMLGSTAQKDESTVKQQVTDWLSSIG